MITPFECHTDPVLSPSNGVEYALRWRTQDIGFWLQYIKKNKRKQPNTTLSTLILSNVGSLIRS